MRDMNCPGICKPATGEILPNRFTSSFICNQFPIISLRILGILKNHFFNLVSIECFKFIKKESLLFKCVKLLCPKENPWGKIVVFVKNISSPAQWNNCSCCPMDIKGVLWLALIMMKVKWPMRPLRSSVRMHHVIVAWSLFLPLKELHILLPWSWNEEDRGGSDSQPWQPTAADVHHGHWSLVNSLMGFYKGMHIHRACKETITSIPEAHLLALSSHNFSPKINTFLISIPTDKFSQSVLF